MVEEDDSGGVLERLLGIAKFWLESISFSCPEVLTDKLPRFTLLIRVLVAMFIVGLLEVLVDFERGGRDFLVFFLHFARSFTALFRSEEISYFSCFRFERLKLRFSALTVKL